MTPELHLVAGPSGAGKSTFARHQPDWEHRLHNLDDWARLRGGVRDPDAREQAWQDIVREMLEQMQAGASPIALDHILDSRAIDEVIEPAKVLGYAVHLTVGLPRWSGHLRCQSGSPSATRWTRALAGHDPATVCRLFGRCCGSKPALRSDGPRGQQPAQHEGRRQHCTFPINVGGRRKAGLGGCLLRLACIGWHLTRCVDTSLGGPSCTLADPCFLARLPSVTLRSRCRHNVPMWPARAHSNRNSVQTHSRASLAMSSLSRRPDTVTP